MGHKLFYNFLFQYYQFMKSLKKKIFYFFKIIVTHLIDTSSILKSNLINKNKKDTMLKSDF